MTQQFTVKEHFDGECQRIYGLFPSYKQAFIYCARQNKSRSSLRIIFTVGTLHEPEFMPGETDEI